MFVGMDVFQIAASLTKRMGKHVNAHEVTHALYDMRELGLVKFHPTKSKRVLRELNSNGSLGSPIGEVPVRIQLTKAGLEKAEYSDASPPIHGAKFVETPRQEEPEEGASPIEPVPIVDIEQAIVIDVSQVIDVGKYPEVHRLINAERNVRSAVEALRRAGQDDLAQMAEDTLKERTPLQQQVIGLVNALLSRRLVQDGAEDSVSE
jgi:hypothetical protein